MNPTLPTVGFVSLTVYPKTSIITDMDWKKYANIAGNLVYIFIIFQALGSGSTQPDTEIERIRQYTRPYEFNYVSWTADAFGIKFSQFSLNLPNFIERQQQKQIVLDYLDLITTIQIGEAELTTIYSDPNITDPAAYAEPLRVRLDDLYHQRSQLGPLAESILQEMLGIILTREGFTLAGQPIPPALYHATPLPWGLIISPRDKIEQKFHISLKPEINVEDHILIEDQIAENLDYSTLVVPVGGLGTYPTMVAQTNNLNWQVTVIAHEWIHIYLTLRPLGANYSKTPEMRTINETAASLFGDEIGAKLIAEFFPERVPPPPPPPPEDPPENVPPPDPPTFDFQAEMYETRVTADQLLAEGKIEEAEAYMETRRQYLWDNGYQIRKLNQAFFAFYGAYADVPGGAAGEDPVGEAVRQLRAESATLKDFIDALAWIRNFEQLFEKLNSP